MSASSIAGWVQGIVVALTGIVIGLTLGGIVGAVIGGIVLGLFAIPWAMAVSEGKPYLADAIGIGRYLIDMSWSLPNTVAGALYYGVLRMTGNQHDLAKSRGTGSIWLVDGVSPDYATTIGTVKAGSNERIDDHEMIHIFQARLFGPLYLPLVGLNYVVATIAPYWLLFKNRKPITGFGSYFEHGVYPHVWNELWAYKYANKPVPVTVPV